MLGTAMQPTFIKPTPTSTSIVDAKVSMFQKTVKHDQSIFHQYREKRHCNQWNTHTIAQTHVQDIYKVFDLKYKANILIEQQLFKMKEKYIFAEFTKRLQTNYVKKLVYQHIEDNNAQQIYEDFLQ